MEHETAVMKHICIETSYDAKQVSSQEKSALKTTYGPKTKELIRDVTFSF